jgi:hypothetical protein
VPTCGQCSMRRIELRLAAGIGHIDTGRSGPTGSHEAGSGGKTPVVAHPPGLSAKKWRGVGHGLTGHRVRLRSTLVKGLAFATVGL